MSHIDGINAFDANNYELAINLFLQAIAENQEQAESYFYLGQSYFFCDEQQLAIPHLEQFIELIENTSNKIANVACAYDLLGQCHEAVNNNTRALICYEKATQIYPEGASAWHNMGLLYIKSALPYLENDLKLSIVYFKDAIIYIKKALKICEANPMFLQSMANWFEQYVEVLKRATMEDESARQQKIAFYFSQAINFYKIALSVCQEQDEALKNIISSNFVECVAQYGHHLYRNDHHQKARETYLQALSLDSNHLIIISQIGMSFCKQEHYPEARQYFSSILEKTEDKNEIADAWLNIACTYRLESEWTKAEEALNHAKTFAPEDDSIAEEEIKLTDSKSAFFLISAPQRLFGALTIDSQNTGNKIVEEASIHLKKA